MLRLKILFLFLLFVIHNCIGLFLLHDSALAPILDVHWPTIQTT